jgi:hypothetical protein
MLLQLQQQNDRSSGVMEDCAARATFSARRALILGTPRSMLLVLLVLLVMLVMLVL